jgi:nucleoside-diphosphate-sugar epimerase
VSEGLWRLLRRPGNPPATRLAYWLSAQECTIDITRARQELGYEPVRTIPEGMEGLRQARSASPETP